jgi:hypothetical protein
VAYFKPVVVGGNAVDLTHLDPFALVFFSQVAGHALRVHVTYSNHCFTEKWDAATSGTDDLLLRDGGGRLRVFCETRYRLSLGLPGIIAKLNHSRTKVWQTARERNWCHAIQIDHPTGPYYVFFEIRRPGVAMRQRQDLNLVVESAYPQDVLRRAPALKGQMNFHLLCGKIFRGQPVSTRR